MNLTCRLKFPFCCAGEHVDGVQYSVGRRDVQNAGFKDWRRAHRAAGAILPNRTFR